MKNGFGRFLHAFFGIKIRFWAFILICAICVGVTYGLTVRSERDRIGGGDNYTQAMKYLEIKNVLDKYYVDDVNEEAVSSAAFDAMVTGLGDKWSDYKPVYRPGHHHGQGRGDRRFCCPGRDGGLTGG